MRVQSQFIEMFGGCANRIKLSSLCSTFVDGDWIESKDQSELGVRLIQTGNVGNGFFKDKEDKSRYISEETFDNLHCTEIYPGDILVSRLPDPIGRACIIPQGIGRTITAVDCTIIRLKDIILPDYFIAYTMTPSYAAQINEVTTGTTRRRVSRANLGNILIPCPSIAKQQQFVAIAKQADKSKFVSFKSQFIEMTTRSELNKKSIGEIAEVRTGSTPSRSNPEYWNGTHYWVSAQDMGNKYIYDTLEKITDKGYATCKVVPAGSILYVCRGSIGVMSINTMDCATNQSICTATCKTGYNTEYLYYALKVAEKAIKKQGIGTSFKSLNQSAFASIEILFPAIEIQDKFATIAKQADKSKYNN